MASLNLVFSLIYPCYLQDSKQDNSPFLDAQDVICVYNEPPSQSSDNNASPSQNPNPNVAFVEMLKRFIDDFRNPNSVFNESAVHPASSDVLLRCIGRVSTGDDLFDGIRIKTTKPDQIVSVFDVFFAWYILARRQKIQIIQLRNTNQLNTSPVTEKFDCTTPMTDAEYNNSFNNFANMVWKNGLEGGKIEQIEVWDKIRIRLLKSELRHRIMLPKGALELAI